MLWPAGSILCTYCSVSAAVAAPPLAHTSAPLIARCLLHVTANLAMPTTIWVPSAAIKFGAAVETSISKSAASKELQARAPPRLSTQHRSNCATSTAHGGYMWRKFRSIHCGRRIYTGLRGRIARQREAALWAPGGSSSCLTLARKVHASVPTRVLHNTASETRRKGVPAVAKVPSVMKWWRACASQYRNAYQQYLGNTFEQHLKATAAGFAGSGACKDTTVRVLQTAHTNATTPRDSSGEVSSLLGDITEKLPLAWAGASGLIRAAATRRNSLENELHMRINNSSLQLSPAVNDCESRSVAEGASQVCMRVQRYCNRLCTVVVCPSNLSPSLWASSSSPPHRAVVHADRRGLLLEPDSLKAHEKVLEVHGVSAIVRKHCATWSSRDQAFYSSRAAAPRFMASDVPSADGISEPATDDATTWHIAPDFLPEAAAGAVAQSGERGTRNLLTVACAGMSGKTAAGNTTATETKAATAARVNSCFIIPLTVLLQQRRALLYVPLLPCNIVSRKCLHLCNSKPQSRMCLSSCRLRGYFSAWLFPARYDRLHTKLLITCERQRFNRVDKMFFSTRVSSISSSAEFFVSKRKTTQVFPLIKPPYFQNSGSGSGTTCAADAAATAAIHSELPPSAGRAEAPAFAAALIATVSAPTDGVSSASAAFGRTWYHHGLARLSTGITHLPHVFTSAGTTWLGPSCPLRRRHYGAASRRLEFCGNIFSGASVGTSISARAASSSKAVAAAAASGQQQLPSQERLLSFDACTIRVPHPNKRDKGGEDASSCSSRLLVVADGVGGWGMSGVDAGLYSRELVQRLKDVFEECCDEKHIHQEEEHKSGGSDSAVGGDEQPLPENARGKAVFERTPDPVQLLKAAYLTTRAIGSSTCCLVVLDRLHHRVRCANIGDSGFILYRPRKDTIIARSNFQSHDFNFPLQLGTGSSDMPEHAHVLELPVEEGDIILLATDGVWDNLYDEQVLEIFRRGLDVHAAAEELSQLAFNCSQDPTWNSPFAAKEKEVLGVPGRHAGGKPDDITVVVAVLKGDMDAKSKACS